MSAELTSWRDGPTRAAITDFVARVTDEGGKDFVPVEERVAVYDNDGTLWTEKPLVINLDFTVHRFGELAEQSPELRTQQPYQGAYEKDLRWLSESVIKHYNGDDADFALVLKAVPAAFESVTVEEYDRKVRDFFAAAANPQLKRPYLDCGYLPMVELLRYLEAHGFTNYIASGGDRDFMRPIAGTMYGIPPERVIGSAAALAYTPDEAGGKITRQAAADYLDDGPEKPVHIWTRTGRRPVLAAGNSNGDIEMLEFSQHATKPHLRLLILHDDASREF